MVKLNTTPSNHLNPFITPQALESDDIEPSHTLSRALIQVFRQAFTDPVFNTLSSTLALFQSYLAKKVLTK